MASSAHNGEPRPEANQNSAKRQYEAVRLASVAVLLLANVSVNDFCTGDLQIDVKNDTPRHSLSMACFALAHIAGQSMMYADMDNASAELC